MINYMKHQGRFTEKEFKGMSYNDIRPQFEKLWKSIHETFKPIDFEAEKKEKEQAKTESRKKSIATKKRTPSEVSQSSKKAKVTSEEPSKRKELSEEELKNMMKIIADEDINVAPLQYRNPICDYEIHYEGERRFWKIFRIGGKTEQYRLFCDMLRNFDRDDLDTLWRIIQDKFKEMSPTDEKEMELWVELKRLYEPTEDDELWDSQKWIHQRIFTWKLFDTCGVHQVHADEVGIDIYMLVERDYPLSNGIMTLMLTNKLTVDEDSEMARTLLRKIHEKCESSMKSSRRSSNMQD